MHYPSYQHLMEDARTNAKNARIAIREVHSKGSLIASRRPPTDERILGQESENAADTLVISRSNQCVDTNFSMRTRVRTLAIAKSMERQESGDFEAHHERTVPASPMNVISMRLAWGLQETISGLSSARGSWN